MYGEVQLIACRFGEDVMETMVGWTAELLHRERPSQPLDAALLDVGTGNGVLPLSLVQLGFTNISGLNGIESHCCKEKGL